MATAGVILRYGSCEWNNQVLDCTIIEVYNFKLGKLCLLVRHLLFERHRFRASERRAFSFGYPL